MVGELSLLEAIDVRAEKPDPAVVRLGVVLERLLDEHAAHPRSAANHERLEGADRPLDAAGLGRERDLDQVGLAPGFLVDPPASLGGEVAVRDRRRVGERRAAPYRRTRRRGRLIPEVHAPRTSTNVNEASRMPRPGGGRSREHAPPFK
jgi:hypothetical protein